MLTFGTALGVNFRIWYDFFFDSDTELNRSKRSSQYDELEDNDIDSLDRYQSNISGYYKFNIKIGYLNINSVVNKIDEVKELLNRNMFDILFLAETKIDSTVSSRLVSHPGFRTIRKDRKKGAGGLLAYIRNDLSAYRRLKLESSDIESICLDVKDSNNSRFILCACYRSPAKCIRNLIFSPPYQQLSKICITPERSCFYSDTSIWTCMRIEMKAVFVT